ncbi:unnamed protein product [Soboliphyme baturini]|uniref:Endoribonuclease n=1 Tax=Soboliphyme baturini TaxID=241478 RepID=A0A183IWU3_9BILA|nr:unnamed protein product [Soboliphyme baturini]
MLQLLIVLFVVLPLAQVKHVDDRELASLIQELETIDLDGAKSRDLRVNYQSHAVNTNKDVAPLPLFEYVNDKILRRPTYQKLSTLVSLYNPYLNETETNTAVKRAAINDFLDEIMKTSVMRRAYQFLHQLKYPSTMSLDQFKESLRQLWFTPYSRKSKNINSCAFEHVFGGEVGQNKVEGLHDWVRFYQLEKSKRINYLGFVVKRRDAVCSVRYTVGKAVKPTGSFLIGASPEFEMATYTLCFLLRRGERKCKFSYKNCPVAVTTIGHSHIITTAYPNPAGLCKGDGPVFRKSGAHPSVH